jgi:polyhydroxyalkanoate synthesis regulator phasin
MKATLDTAKGKVLAVAATCLLGAGLVGGAAFAATPSGSDAAMAAAPSVDTAAADKDKGDRAGKLKAILDGLVDKGVITRAQADAILDAVQKADHGDKHHHHEFVGDVFKASATYLGMTDEQLKTALATGKSLGEVANATPGKSRNGLVDTLTAQANQRIAQALKDGKITADQAEKLRTETSAAIIRIVDHEHGKKPTPVQGQTKK